MGEKTVNQLLSGKKIVNRNELNDYHRFFFSECKILLTIYENFYVLIDSFKISEDFLKFSDVLFEQNNCLLTMIGQATKIFRRFDGSIIFALG